MLLEALRKGQPWIRLRGQKRGAFQSPVLQTSRSIRLQLPGDTPQQMCVITRKRFLAACITEPLLELFRGELPQALDLHPKFSIHSSVPLCQGVSCLSMDALSSRKSKLVLSV